MWVLFVMAFLAFLLASYAKSKGRSFWLWFIVSFVFDPILAFIFLWVTSFFVSKEK